MWYDKMGSGWRWWKSDNLEWWPIVVDGVPCGGILIHEFHFLFIYFFLVYIDQRGGQNIPYKCVNLFIVNIF